MTHSLYVYYIWFTFLGANFCLTFFLNFFLYTFVLISLSLDPNVSVGSGSCFYGKVGFGFQNMVKSVFGFGFQHFFQVKIRIRIWVVIRGSDLELFVHFFPIRFFFVGGGGVGGEYPLLPPPPLEITPGNELWTSNTKGKHWERQMRAMLLI